MEDKKKSDFGLFDNKRKFSKEGKNEEEINKIKERVEKIEKDTHTLFILIVSVSFFLLSVFFMSLYNLIYT